MRFGKHRREGRPASGVWRICVSALLSPAARGRASPPLASSRSWTHGASTCLDLAAFPESLSPLRGPNSRENGPQLNEVFVVPLLRFSLSCRSLSPDKGDRQRYRQRPRPTRIQCSDAQDPCYTCHHTSAEAGSLLPAGNVHRPGVIGLCNTRGNRGRGGRACRQQPPDRPRLSPCCWRASAVRAA